MRSDADARFLARVRTVGFGVGVLAWSMNAIADDAAAARATVAAIIAQWAGNEDTDAFLRQPAVRAELKHLLGPELAHLEENLNVRGAVALVSGALYVDGNAPHRGTEEEAIVCVIPPKMTVEAAIFSRGKVTVYTRAEQYEYASRCIKDWITLANSGHVGRFRQPVNVRVVRPR